MRLRDRLAWAAAGAVIGSIAATGLVLFYVGLIFDPLLGGRRER